MKKNFEKNLLKQNRPFIFRIRKIPKKYKDDIFKFYSFYYVTNNLVNSENSDAEGLKYIIRRWQSIKRDDFLAKSSPIDDSINEKAINNLSYLVNRYDISTRDVDDYFRSLALRLRNKQLQSTQDFVRYLHYSSEAPAQMIVKVLELPNATVHHAKMMARSLQVINILLGINSSSSTLLLLPKSELKKYGLDNFDDLKNKASDDAFNKFVQLQLKRYKAWRDESKKGDAFLPKKLKPLVRQTRAKYDLTASMIEKRPSCLLDNTFKHPSKIRVKINTVVNRK